MAVLSSALSLWLCINAPPSPEVDPQLEQLERLTSELEPTAEARNELADLRDPVDRFFDDVMVMAEDEAVRNNRLALLGELRALFLDVADISRLSIA